MNKRKSKICRRISNKIRCTGEAHNAQFANEQLCAGHQFTRWGKLARNWTEAEARAYVANLESK